MPRWGGEARHATKKAIGCLRNDTLVKIKMTYQCRFVGQTETLYPEPVTLLLHVLLKQNVQRTRHRSLTNRHNRIRNDSCIINSDSSNRYKCADRGYSLYSGLSKVTYSPQCFSRSVCHTAPHYCDRLPQWKALVTSTT